MNFKQSVLTCALALSAFSTSTKVEAWESLPRLAADVTSNVADVLRDSDMMGDRGYAVSDLRYFLDASYRFQSTLSFYDYQNLWNAYSRSRSTWAYLRAYNYSYNKLMWIDGDMNEIRNFMDRGPLPPPPPRDRVISLTAPGKGGSTEGDRQAACQRASDRAFADVVGQCSRYRGNVQSTRYGSCNCRGPNRDLVCETHVVVSCVIQ